MPPAASMTFAIPKSRIFTDERARRRRASRKTLSGLRSRCTMPCACAAARPARMPCRMVHRLRERDATAVLRVRAERHAVEQLHHEVRRAVLGLRALEHADDVRVHQARGRCALPRGSDAGRRASATNSGRRTLIATRRAAVRAGVGARTPRPCRPRRASAPSAPAARQDGAGQRPRAAGCAEVMTAAMVPRFGTVTRLRASWRRNVLDARRPPARAGVDVGVGQRAIRGAVDDVEREARVPGGHVAADEAVEEATRPRRGRRRRRGRRARRRPRRRRRCTTSAMSRVLAGKRGIGDEPCGRARPAPASASRSISTTSGVLAEVERVDARRGGAGPSDADALARPRRSTRRRAGAGERGVSPRRVGRDASPRRREAPRDEPLGDALRVPDVDAPAGLRQPRRAVARRGPRRRPSARRGAVASSGAARNTGPTVKSRARRARRGGARARAASSRPGQEARAHDASARSLSGFCSVDRGRGAPTASRSRGRDERST